MAYDLPLVHPAGGNIPWSDLVAVSRTLAVEPAPAPHRRAGPRRGRPGIPVVDARDATLRDRDGRVKGGHTGLMAALDSLVRDEPAWTRTEAPDPYCASVHDFTHW